MKQTEPLLSLIVGARPNFVKAAPIIHRLKKSTRLSMELIHSGQHYDYLMSKSFFDLFRIPEPDFNLEIGSGLHGEQTGRMLMAFEKLFLERQPSMVVVLGDVNSTLAASLAAVKLHIPVAHVEAGLRSFDRSMPEEINRVTTDHLSNLLFVTEKAGMDNLIAEGITGEGVVLSGNVMIDAVEMIRSQIESSTITSNLKLTEQEYSVVTLHRPSNVDSKAGLQRCLEFLRIALKHGPVVFPLHPRTRKSISNFSMDELFKENTGLHMMGPLAYADFLSLVKRSSFIMTDSGGIQSEASYLKVPCITLRDSTEHLITIEQGTNTLTGLNPKAVMKAVTSAVSFDKAAYTVPSLLDGKASNRICQILEKHPL